MKSKIIGILGLNNDRYYGISRLIKRRNFRILAVIFGTILALANKEKAEDLNLYFIDDYREELRLIIELENKQKTLKKQGFSEYSTRKEELIQIITKAEKSH